ncbi:MAG: substrate-binding periplasmic protein [Negativicutes bacterium]
MRNRIQMIATVLISITLLAFVAAGCGSSASTPAPAPTKKTALATVKERGKLIIATSGNFAPMTYVDGAGELAGFDIELGKLLAKGLGVEVQFTTGNIAALLPGMLAGQFDIVMSGLAVTDKRRESIDFTTAYGTSAQTAVALVGNKSVTGLDNLSGLVVGSLSGTPQHEWVTKKGGYKDSKEYPGNAEAFTDLKTGRIDLYVVSTIVAGDYIKRDTTTTNKLQMVGKPVNPVEMAVGLRKNEPEFKAALDEIIKKLAADGTLNKLGVKYVGAPIPLTKK